MRKFLSNGLLLMSVVNVLFVVVTSWVFRFSHPSLTETQLFLAIGWKMMFGLSVAVLFFLGAYWIDDDK